MATKGNMQARPIDMETLVNDFPGLAAGFVRVLTGLTGGHDPAVLLAAALASRAASEGHVCIDLSQWAQQPVTGRDPSESQAVGPALETWLAHLRSSPLVGRPGQWRPLILDRRHFLYLQRFHQDEQAVAARLRALGRTAAEPGMTAPLTERLTRYFPEPRPGETDWQRIAAVVAVMRGLCIISGAPGTGKTTTAAKIIGLLMEIYAPQALRFCLCAPTGKAAARFSEALAAAAERLPCGSEVQRRFPTAAATIHRTLGYGRHRFRFNATHPLPADVVVVDEASMVDLVLMARLLDAMPPEARLIILGDRDQLSSVEAGAVMGDICQGAVPELRAAALKAVGRPYAPDSAPKDTTPPWPPSVLSDNVVILERNYRFEAGQGVDALIRAVNAGDHHAVGALLADPPPGIQWLQPPLGPAQRRQLVESIVAGYGPLFDAATVEEALAQLDRFMVLCALTRGPWGRERLNTWIESRLRQGGWISDPHPWYRGRPVIIRRNDYRAGLFNGDVGVAWVDSDGGPSERRIWFRLPNGQLRSFTPAQLPEHQTALALTVHKSQGSEYQRVLLALPEKDSPVLTRELLYTGLSRARRGVLLVANRRIIDLTLSCRTTRASGLHAALERKSQGAPGPGTPRNGNGEAPRW